MNIKDLVGATLKEVFIYQYIDDYSNPDEPEDECAMLFEKDGKLYTMFTRVDDGDDVHVQEGEIRGGDCRSVIA